MEAQGMEGPVTSTISAHDASVKERTLVNLLLGRPPTRIADGRLGINPAWSQRHCLYMYSQIFGAFPLYWGRSTAAFGQSPEAGYLLLGDGFYGSCLHHSKIQTLIQRQLSVTGGPDYTSKGYAKGTEVVWSRFC